jgi:hypothetical protein
MIGSNIKPETWVLSNWSKRLLRGAIEKGDPTRQGHSPTSKEEKPLSSMLFAGRCSTTEEKEEKER